MDTKYYSYNNDSEVGALLGLQIIYAYHQSDRSHTEQMWSLKLMWKSAKHQTKICKEEEYNIMQNGEL